VVKNDDRTVVEGELLKAKVELVTIRDSTGVIR
jgi:hypothetical protein